MQANRELSRQIHSCLFTWGWDHTLRTFFLYPGPAHCYSPMRTESLKSAPWGTLTGTSYKHLFKIRAIKGLATAAINHLFQEFIEGLLCAGFWVSLKPCSLHSRSPQMVKKTVSEHTLLVPGGPSVKGPYEVLQIKMGEDIQSRRTRKRRPARCSLACNL